MAYAITHVDQVPVERGPHPAASPYDRRVSDALGLTGFAVYQVEVPPGASTEPHDHQHDGVEDAYAVVSGSGWLVVDGDEVPLRVGHFVAVTQESVRHVRAGDEGCVLIAVCG